jgi:hypothetical protein
MITKEGSASAVFLSMALSFALTMAALVFALLLVAAPAHAQNVQVDLSSTSALCGGQQCFNTAGLFDTGTTFLGTSGMDNGNNCTPTPPYTNCPDAYSANQLFGSSFTNPPTLTLGGVPFTFGSANTANCGSTGTACTVDVVNFTSSGVAITLPVAQQTVYSTAIMLGTAVNGHHSGKVTATYTDSSTTVFNQTLSDWCGFGSNQYESIAIGGINRINSDGTLNGASCNLYAYTYPLDFTKTLQSITLTDTDGSGASFALAITLKPPTYTIDGGTPDSTTVSAGSSTTAVITVNPQPGYVGTVQLACSVSPTIASSGAATAPTCSLSPTSVDVTANESAAPTTTLTFTAAKAAQASLGPHPIGRHSGIFYAFLLVPAVALTGLGFGTAGSRRKRFFGMLMLGLLLAAVMVTPGCVSYKHLGNVGTPPGQYTISITGVDGNGLTQASNPTGTSNTVVVTVTD